MVEPEELWIGEQLQSLKSGKIGRYAGIHSSGKVRLKIRDKVFLISPSNLEIFIPKNEKNLIEVDQEANRISTYIHPSKSIDLHIEILNPNLQNSRPERILDYQLKSFENYLEKCKRSRFISCKIIHGKGTGVLKSSIHSILKTEPEVLHFYLTNEGGATEVFFKY